MGVSGHKTDTVRVRYSTAATMEVAAAIGKVVSIAAVIGKVVSIATAKPRAGKARPKKTG